MNARTHHTPRLKSLDAWESGDVGKHAIRAEQGGAPFRSLLRSCCSEE